MAVRPDFPQAVAGGFVGFDIDVTTSLAEALGLTLQLQIRSVADMLAPSEAPGIDAAMPSDVSAIPGADLYLASEPYYHWPVYLLVADASTARAAADLAGRTVCAQSGSSGDSWLVGEYDGQTSTPLAAPPVDVSVRREVSDRECLAALEQGEVDAIVSATLSAADLTTRSLRPLGGPVLTEPRSILAQRAGPDPSAFIDEVDRALSRMRTDGTLIRFSQSRFGGNDLTSPATP
jgi:ABC-type amino acid transport substrate-binding protein